MPPKRRRNKNNNNVKCESEALKQCKISKNPQPDIKMNKEIPLELLAKWPKENSKVPALFLHLPTQNLEGRLDNVAKLLKQIHNHEILGNGKCFVQSATNNYIKFSFQTLDMHKFLVAYLDRNKAPYHTFGYSNKRMMKVVVRDLPTDTDLNAVKEHLQYASIPVARIHKMHAPDSDKHNTILILVVLPNTRAGQKILRVTHILGHAVKLEPPHPKVRQCYRCQKWGHSQRFCRGKVKCVKCAGDHLTHKCTKGPEDPPKCANCDGAHTANYKKCSSCPESIQYKMALKAKDI